MYPDNFNDCSFEQLAQWRTKILSDLQQAQEKALDAGVHPGVLKMILSTGIALGKVESQMQNRG